MMTRMKKTVALFLTAILMVTLLPSCGNSASESAAAGTASTEASATETVSTGDGTTTSTQTSSDQAVVKIGFAKGSLCVAPVHLAYLNGYFEKEFAAAGITWSYEEVDLTQAAELLAAGKINACFGLTASLIQPIDNGLDIVFTTGLHTGCTKYFVKSDSSINSVSDLKGKTVGVPGLSDSSTMNLKRKLLEVGIDPSEVTFAEYSLTDLPLALENGAVDAVALHDPVGYQAQQEYGFKLILDTGTDEKFAGEYCCQAYVSADLVSTSPEGAAAYTRALQEAAAFIQAEPEQAAEIQLNNGFCSGDLDTNAKLLESYNYSPSVSAGLETFENCVKELKETGDLSDSTDVDEFISQHYVKLDGVPDSMTYDPDTQEFTEST
ncbi:MAG: ABC-type nitrate/sulfonate/bicarbonate transport system periplasmic component-like protein [Oscillospiraceae bacterium]|nr:ABC-type nitrate/sulfonate/bicarbonate transport system periplasmic component-like protein [Oscillospiraceae bacterium]